MLIIEAKLPTKDLPIRRILSKLFQSFIYKNIDDKEHDGYKHPNGKVFKSMNFKIAYIENMIEIKFVALDKNNEKKIAEYILHNKLELGEIHIVQTTISIEKRYFKTSNRIKVGGFISCAIKDGKSKNKIYLEPKTDKFQEILYNNTIEKYQALFNKSYKGNLNIRLIDQKPRERIFYYSRGAIKAWYGVYEIEADSDMLNMILDSGIGANCMKGLGFVEIIR